MSGNPERTIIRASIESCWGQFSLEVLKEEGDLAIVRTKFHDTPFTVPAAVLKEGGRFDADRLGTIQVLPQQNQAA